MPKKTNKTSFFKSFPLVERKPLKTFVPNISEPQKETFAAALQKITGAMPAKHVVEMTPKGTHIKPNEQGICGVTESGSKLISSPSKTISITLTSPDGEKKESVEVALLIREKDYIPKKGLALFASLEANLLSDQRTLSITATPETRESQPPRKQARKESSAVKNTAKGLVFNYFKSCGVTIAASEIEKENWNLCHLLSYGIAMNAKSEDGKTFNTQVYNNIYSGTRVFNENMMRIENVLLQLLNDHDTKKIHYLALSSEFEDSHILASLTLKINIETNNGAFITFDIPFDVADDRKLSHEASTVFYATIQALSQSFDKDSDKEVSKTLTF